MASSENMASSIKVKNIDLERLETIRAKLSFNGMNLNQEELFSKLLNLGENFINDLNLKTEAVDRNDLNT